MQLVFHCFSFFTESLYVFSCQWNYRPDHCIYGSNCLEAEKEGIFILHGNRGVYHDDKQPAFRAIYESLRNVSTFLGGWRRLLNLVISGLAPGSALGDHSCTQLPHSLYTTLVFHIFPGPEIRAMASISELLVQDIFIVTRGYLHPSCFYE